MFAVIKTGGKQYRVVTGQRLTVERLAAEAGDTIQFNDVLLLGGDDVTVGTPTIAGAAVQAEVVEQTRGDKVINFKRRRRKASSKRLKGHRQHLTLVEVTEILAKGGEKSGVSGAIGAREARRNSEVAPAVAKPKAAKPEPKAKAQPKDTPAAETKSAKKTATEESEATKPGNLLKAAKGDADDLTKLGGVGPKLQEKLNANGVFHFWQIAEWTPAEVAHMDDQLSFKGRIERDDWIGQAKTFAAETE